MRALILALLLAACGGGATAPPQPRADTGVAEVNAPARTIEAACNDIAAAACKDFDSCRFAPRTQYANATDCWAGHRLSCVRDANAPGVVDPVARLDRCSRALYALSCEERVRWPSECNRSPGNVRGTLPDGVRCWRQEQCASGACRGAMVPALPNCGTCGHLPIVGDRCTSDDGCRVTTFNSFDTDLVCDRTTGACVRGGAPGEPCTDARGCALPLRCAASFCRPIQSQPVGAPCSDTALCESGLYCSRTELVCRTQVFVPPGAACDRSEEGPPARVCTAGSYCHVDRVCLPRPTLGQDCTASRSETFACGWDAVC